MKNKKRPSTSNMLRKYNFQIIFHGNEKYNFEKLHRDSMGGLEGLTGENI